MTKRCGDYQPATSKKSKLDDEEIWGDDIDEDALDKCFELASQVEENNLTCTQSKNITLLPTYNSFKNPSGFASSTQANISASTSKKLSVYELEAEVNKLKQQNAQKEGEISILRSTMTKTHTMVKTEQNKTTADWREKLQATQKEIRTVKGDLEFKNLEIANLKHQLAELRRHNNLDATLNFSQKTVAVPVKVNTKSFRAPLPVKKESLKKEVILESFYPFKHISPKNFDHHTEERHVKKSSSYKVSRNIIPYLQNQQTLSDSYFQHKCSRIEDKDVNLHSIYPEIFSLVNSTLEDLNSDGQNEAVKKIICVALLLLEDLRNYLVEFGTYLRTEDIQQADTNYLLDDTERRFDLLEMFHKDELGIKSGKIISFLSELLPYNNNIVGFICQNKSFKLTRNTEEYLRHIPHKNGFLVNDFCVLKIILDIVKYIGKYRRSSVSNGFLMSVSNLLINIMKSNNYDNVKDIFCKLFKEMTFARPGPEILYRITFLLKIGSQYSNFVEFLFEKNEKTPLEADSKGVLYYTEDACSFCVLSMLLQNTLQNTDVPLASCFNMMSFISNIFKISHLIHHESSNKVCVCISQLYKLEIEIAFKAMEQFVERFRNKRITNDDWNKFLRYEVAQKVLNLMSFNNYELTEKYVIVYTKFKKIEKYFKNEVNFIQLNTSDEIRKIPEKNYPTNF